MGCTEVKAIPYFTRYLVPAEHLFLSEPMMCLYVCTGTVCEDQQEKHLTEHNTTQQALQMFLWMPARSNQEIETLGQCTRQCTHPHTLTTPHPRVHTVTGCFSSLSQLWCSSVSVIKVRWLQQYTPKAPTGLVNFKCLDIDTSWPGMVTLWWVRMACWCFSNILD